MAKLIKKSEEFVDKIIQNPIGLSMWIFVFLSIIFLRLFLDNLAAKTGSYKLGTIMDVHNVFFFLIIILLIWLYLSLIIKKNPLQLASLMLWPALLILLPPLLDMAKTGGSVFWSSYLINDFGGLLEQFVTIFGHLPSGVVYFGTKIMFLLGILFSAGLVFIKTKSILKTIVSAFFVYLIVFFMGSFPSWFAFSYFLFQKSVSLANVGSIQIIQFVGTPLKIFGLDLPGFSEALAKNLNLVYFPLLFILLSGLFFWGNKEKFWAVVKNLRFPQLVYHAGLLFAGLGLGYLSYSQNLSWNLFSILAVFDLLLSVWLAWEASVVVNDIYDLKIDEISNPDRPLPRKIFEIKEYGELGLAFFILSLLGGMAIGVKFMALMLAFQIIAWFYSAQPYRLKRFPGIATFLSAAAALPILFSGFILFSGGQNIQGLSPRIIVLLLTTLTLSLPIKDLKDIEGDRKDKIFTIPVILGESKGRLVIAATIFVSFMLSVFLLNEFRLFFWALLFGAISFLIAQSKKINPRDIFWWVLGLVGIYGIILAKIIFFSI